MNIFNKKSLLGLCVFAALSGSLIYSGQGQSGGFFPQDGEGFCDYMGRRNEEWRQQDMINKSRRSAAEAEEAQRRIHIIRAKLAQAGFSQCQINDFLGIPNRL